MSPLPSARRNAHVHNPREVHTGIGRKNTSPDELIQLFCLQIATDISGVVKKHVLPKLAAKKGLNIGQLNILVAIARRGGKAKPSQISRTICLDRSSVTRHLSQLQKKGFIVVGNDSHDMRGKVAALTEAGFELCEEYDKRIYLVTQKLDSYYHSQLSEEDLSIILKALRLLARRTYQFSKHSREITEKNVATSMYSFAGPSLIR